MKKNFIEYSNGIRIEVDIPSEFSYKEGNIDNGLVIENDTGEYVRIPTGYTADGMYVKGFWVSRYEISVGPNNEPLSISNQYPVTNINFYDALKLAQKVNGVLPSREEYNRICYWLVQTKAVTFDDVFVKGNGKGNYADPFRLAKTGANEQWMFNKIDNFFGNCYIWTSEKSEICSHCRVIRGGPDSFFFSKENHPPTFRTWLRPECGGSSTSLRIVIRDLEEDDED